MSYQPANSNPSFDDHIAKNNHQNSNAPQCLIHLDTNPQMEAILLPIYSVNVYTEFHISVALVSIKVIFLNDSATSVSGLFQFPTLDSKINITSCDIFYSDKAISMAIIDPDDVKYKTDSLLENVLNNSKKDINTFEIPFASCPSQSQIIVELKYTQDLHFSRKKGEFDLLIPMTFSLSQRFYQQMSPESCTFITFKIFPGSQIPAGYLYGTYTHDLIQSNCDHYNIATGILKSHQNCDINIFYHTCSDTISNTCVFQPIDGKNEGSFLIFMNPPTKNQTTRPIARDIVFLLDRSGSMSGSPMNQAKQAVVTALQALASKVIHISLTYLLIN